MSIIPASRLSPSDLALLSNNIRTEHRPPRRSAGQLLGRAQVAAVNRSLASYGEAVGKLHKPLLAISLSGGRRLSPPTPTVSFRAIP